MAKSAAKAKAKARSGGVKIAPKVKSKHATKLADIMDLHAIAEQKKSRKKTGPVRNMQETIVKKVRDNFTGFTEWELSSNIKNGCNVFKRLETDLERLEQGEPIVMGKLYYEQLRQLYRDPDSPINQLTPIDVNEEVDTQMEKAIELMLDSRRSLVEAHEWACNVENINQLNVVALFRAILRLPAAKSLENAAVGLAVMQMCARLQLPERFPLEWVIAKHHFDACLLKTLATFKSEERTSRDWWVRHRDAAKLLLPLEATTTVLDVEGDSWSHVKDQVDQVAASCEVGKRLMAKMLRQLEVERVDDEVDKTIVEMLKLEQVTSAVVSQLKKGFADRLKARGIDAYQSYLPRKSVKIRYRGVRIPPVVTSPMDHCSCAIEAAIRGVAAHMGLIVKLWCEDELVTNDNSGNIKGIDANMLTVVKDSRLALSDQLDADLATAAAIAKVIKQKKNFLSSNDRYVRIELSFWTTSMGDAAEGRVKDMIRDALPATGKPKTLADSVIAFKKIGESRLLNFAGPTPQHQFTMVNKWVQALANGRCPDIAKSNLAGFALEVRQRLELFVTEGDKVGQEALTEKWSSLKASLGADSKPQYRQLTVFIRFNWMMKAAANKELQTLVKSAIKDEGGSSSASNVQHGGGSSCSSAAASASLKKIRKSDTKALVKSLFAK